MPRGRRQRFVASSSDEESEDGEFLISQLTQSQRHKKAKTDAPIEDENINTFVVNTVKLILQYSVSKTPFKRSDLVRVAMNSETRAIIKVMDKVKKILADIYQMELHEVKHISSNKQYICISKLPHSTTEEVTTEEKPEIVLLYLVLSYIFMKGGEVTDIGLWQYLEKFKIYQKEEHDYFGEPYYLIHDLFPKQLYLHTEKTVTEASHEEKIIIKWGQRADLEYSKKDMLDYVAAKTGVPPIQYIQQYQEAYGSIDGENIDAEMSGLGLSSQPRRNQPTSSRSRSNAMDIDSTSSDDEII